MNAYYAHEIAYQKLLSEGGDCWGNDDFERVSMAPFLERALLRMKLDERAPLKTLVLGCGTGPIACMLARRGHRVTGVDISPTAIDMARTQANKRALEIEYLVADVCRDELPKTHYDLIVDSHFLHCIVTEPDRQSVFEAIHGVLASSGHFILETMIGPITTATHKTDVDGILWRQYGLNKPPYEPRVQRNGVWHVPQRQLRPTPESMDCELMRHRFEIVWRHVVDSTDPHNAADYQALCRHAVQEK